MAYDAFTAGVELGGLRNKDEIRILLCYLLSSVNAPLSRDDILQSVQGLGLANYFELTDALEELTENGNLLLQDNCYTASAQARAIAQQLDTALPLSVRDKAVRAALGLLAQARRERENAVDITKCPCGYRVQCHISGGKEEMMSLSLTVPDVLQAQLIKHNFQESPQRVYQMLLALLTDDREMAESLLKE
ncbi:MULTISPECIES: DUF4364 family protein [Caproicibacterium]|uniref:DUF4364 family protein n=1 Tax=Caproicibacterium argilliputei TaxID=3030016 RepID=A0AA97DBJ6_9FIRM|nr:DUF4364 family protein [Caproicibacterium argilliputei]WOC33237.1 DUF4364 family protein [Caproicibacterium argilliputei]